MRRRWRLPPSPLRDGRIGSPWKPYAGSRSRHVADRFRAHDRAARRPRQGRDQRPLRVRHVACIRQLTAPTLAPSVFGRGAEIPGKFVEQQGSAPPRQPLCARGPVRPSRYDEGERPSHSRIRRNALGNTAAHHEPLCSDSMRHGLPCSTIHSHAQDRPSRRGKRLLQVGPDICAHLANAQSEAERRNRLAAARGVTDRYCRCGPLAQLAWPGGRCDESTSTRGRTGPAGEQGRSFWPAGIHSVPSMASVPETLVDALPLMKLLPALRAVPPMAMPTLFFVMVE